MPIPTHVKRTDLSEALKPLCDLLGTSPRNFYDSPGMTIGNGVITFNVPANHEDDPSGRTVSLMAVSHPQGDEFAEQVYAVRVEVVDQ